MDNKTIAILAVVAGIALIMTGCTVVLANNANNVNNTDDGGVDDAPVYYQPTTRLLVYGNANNDNYLDQKDVEFIKDIIDRKTAWDPFKNARADANVDGVVDKADLELVEKFIAGEPATMYYNNWDGQIRSVDYPLSGKIGGYDTNTLDVLTILGVENDFVASGDTPETIAKYSEKMYPGAAKRCMSIRGENRDYKPELVFASGIKILFGASSNAGDAFVNTLHEGDPSINVIQLPIGYYGNIDTTYTIVTVAAMMNIQANIAGYIDYLDNIEKMVEDRISAIAEKYGDQTFCIMYRLGEAGETVTSVDTIGVGPGQFADVMNVMKLPLKPTMIVPNDRGFLRNIPIEKILDTNPDILFVETFNTLSSNATDDEIRADFQHRVSLINETEAYANNKVITMNYEVMGSTPGVSTLLALSALLWPDMFDYEEGLDIMNQYYRTFTHAGADFDVREHFGYAPLLWGKDNSH